MLFTPTRPLRAILLAGLEKALFCLLIAMVVLPLAMAAWLRVSHDTSNATLWLRNMTLRGLTYPSKHLPLSRSTVLSARYQAKIALDYDHSYAGREFMIRVVNELYVRLFQVSETVAIGRRYTLFDQIYINEYALDRRPQKMFRKLVDNLRRLQDFCEVRGIAFALMITPSKVSIYPEDLPPGWHRRVRPGPRYYDNLLPLLKDRGIHYVDGPRIVAALKPSVKIPLFPRGGMHWMDRAALGTGNALLELLASQRLPVEPITQFKTRVTEYPKDDWDRDLADLANRVTRVSYPVEEITAQPIPKRGGYFPNIVFMGGSFDWKILRLFDESDQFAEIDLFDYYRQSKCCETDGVLHKIASPAPPLNFDTEIFAADALVLELNQQAMYSPNHVTRFLRDALAALPDPRSPKAPFRHVGQELYRWGDALSMVAGKNPPKLIAGFTAAGEQGTYTDGPIASIRLGATLADQDMKLEVTASAFVVGERLPAQEVGVSIDNVTVGEMVWKSTEQTPQTLLIPKELLGSGRVHLQFHVTHPTSPADLGLSTDPRKLGICVSTVRFTPMKEMPPGGRGGIYHWGETLSLTAGPGVVAAAQLTGFTAPSENGSYTDGPVAGVQFIAPPASQGLILSVDAGAFVVDTRLPEQRADVFVNGHALGQWTWKDGASSSHDLPVPRECLPGGSTRLEFRIARPTSPADLGLGGDLRKFGISISKIRLHEAGK